MLNKLFSDETGAVVSAELILVLTITFCAAAVGWSTIGSAVVSELNDVSEMIGTVDQSYNFVGHSATAANSSAKGHGQCAASGYNDRNDDCDCKGIALVSTCGKTQTATVAAAADGNTEG